MRSRSVAQVNTTATASAQPGLDTDNAANKTGILFVWKLSACSSYWSPGKHAPARLAFDEQQAMHPFRLDLLQNTTL